VKSTAKTAAVLPIASHTSAVASLGFGKFLNWFPPVAIAARRMAKPIFTVRPIERANILLKRFDFLPKNLAVFRKVSLNFILTVRLSPEKLSRFSEGLAVSNWIYG
jgi:hypothetical protein